MTVAVSTELRTIVLSTVAVAVMVCVSTAHVSRGTSSRKRTNAGFDQSFESRIGSCDASGGDWKTVDVLEDRDRSFLRDKVRESLRLPLRSALQSRGGQEGRTAVLNSVWNCRIVVGTVTNSVRNSILVSRSVCVSVRKSVSVSKRVSRSTIVMGSLLVRQREGRREEDSRDADDLRTELGDGQRLAATLSAHEDRRE